ncbi:hypothetical protein IZ6_06290 [Terrihabitans soli]|uniref:Uncharacterized protein n=1 Tax=Terrihabitans soli TaxID=708113 RepID=A0A6S6QI55_9HYPH|nr:hypothetical protein IZ6_06290 [Terrihabitans soli]
MRERNLAHLIGQSRGKGQGGSPEKEIATAHELYLSEPCPRAARTPMHARRVSFRRNNGKIGITMKAQHSSFHSDERLYRQAGIRGTSGRRGCIGTTDRGKSVVAAAHFCEQKKKHGG